MKQTFVIAAVALLTACGASTPPPDTTLEAAAVEAVVALEVTDRHLVTVLGTPSVDDPEAIAEWQSTLIELIERSDADAIFVDVAAERVERLLSLTIDPATPSEGDFVEVVAPWAAEHAVEVVPVSAWGDTALRDVFDYERRFPHGPIEREALARRAMFMAALIEHTGGLDVRWLNSVEFAELSGEAERWAAFYGEQERGEAGIFRVASRTLAAIDDALAALPPSRVLVLVPATSRYFVEPGIEALGDVVLIGPERLF